KGVGFGRGIPVSALADLASGESVTSGPYLSLPSQGRDTDIGPEPCGPGLAEREIHVALSQQVDGRKVAGNQVVSPRTIRQRGAVLRKSISEMEHDRALRRLFVSDWQARSDRSLLRAPEQYREETQSTNEPVRVGSKPLLLG